MEKLQAALQKAREQRGGSSSGAKPVADSLRQPADELWAELNPHTLDPRVLEKARIVTTQAGPEGVPYDILRTKVLLTMRKNNWTRLAITSPKPGCGKTTAACNLALSLTRNSDARVILFEFDLRRPTIRATLGLPSTGSILEMLMGDRPFAEHALRIQDNLAVAAAQQAESDPTAALLNARSAEVIGEIERAYAPDVTIFDLPPLLVGDDTRAVLKDMDCALILAKAEETTIGDIDSSEREVAEHTNVLGIVLNACRYTEENYGGYNA